MELNEIRNTSRTMEKNELSKENGNELDTPLSRLMSGSALLDDPRDAKLDKASKVVKDFLLKNEPEFVRVTQYRDRGWIENNDKGDAFFKKQREVSDKTDAVGEKRFYNMMIEIGDEMQTVTGALTLQGQGRDLRVLDICMAPGGYTAATLKYNPHALAYGITLAANLGGHPLHIDTSKLAGVKYLDVTLLYKEFSDVESPPRSHPDYANFNPFHPYRAYKFALVFCDGMVLRTHERPSYRELNELTRLSCSQLILAMQRIAAGGTLVMLLHKIDSWGSAIILYTFSKFAEVQVFKPAKKHSARSSFYMIAKDVQPEHEAAKRAVQEWRDVWWKTTFGGEDGTGEKKEEPNNDFVSQVLDEFGGKLIELGSHVWSIQADALAKTDYAGDCQKVFEGLQERQRSGTINNTSDLRNKE